MKWLLIFLVVGCSTPTLQQRQDNWRKYRTSVETVCKAGEYDPAMPVEVRAWCNEVRP